VTASIPHDTAPREPFGELGYLGPLRVLSARECRRFLTSVGVPGLPPPVDWDKGQAVASPPFFEIATHPAIVERVAALLGENVLLWGASIVPQRPGSAHAWHTDIEAALAGGRTLTVWIGLENCTHETALRLVARSHRLGLSVQELRARLGPGAAELGEPELLAAARERDPRCELVAPDMSDGEALFIDGCLWHGTHNRSARTRRALLLQYATPECVIRIPELNQRSWPFRQLQEPRPACIMIRGSDESGANRIVPGPAAVGGAPHRLSSRVQPLTLPLAPDREKGWKPYPLFRGATADLERLGCHVSVLTQGSCPHPPHTHDDDELLLLLAGEADLLLPEDPEGGERRRLAAGELVYYPAGFPHSLVATSDEPASYLMFKWVSPPTGTEKLLPFGQYDLRESGAPPPGGKGFHQRPLFEGATRGLRKLHAHVSSLAPGAGYAPHADAYDVALVVLEGEVETLGQRVAPHGVVFYPAGELHGMRNPGAGAARYVVFEFHGSRGPRPPRTPASILRRLADPARWRRRLGRLRARARGR
jgi:quercetin dioxygenase-like cupin family protein